jgi:hypothetical protein
MCHTLPQLEMCLWATWQTKYQTVLLQKRVTISGCHLGTSNPVNFTILNPGNPKWKNDQQIAIYINEWGNDTGTILFFKRITVSNKALSHQIFHSFYEEMERMMSPISTTTRNLLL